MAQSPLSFAALGTTAPAAVAAAPEAAAPAREGRPAPTVYGNLGITIPMTDDQGVTEDVFISLPIGIAIDTMEAMEPKGSSVKWNQMIQAKNFVLEQLKAAGAALEPGETQMVEGIEFQLRRVGQAAPPVIGENPYLAALSGKLTVVK